MPRKSSTRSGRRKSQAKRPKTQEPKSYKHLIPAPDAILMALSESGVPMGFAGLARRFDVKDDQLRKRLKNRLNKMIASGQLIKNRRDEYCLLDKLDAVTGKVSAHRDGFGFLIRDTDGDDIFLPPHAMRMLMDGDRVAVHISGTDRKGRPKGDLVEILERGNQTAVGRYCSERGLHYVIESSRSLQRYMLAPKDTGGARDGEMVKLEIVAYPTNRREAQGRVVEVLGALDDPGMLTRLAIESFGLRTEWPDAAQELADSYGAKVKTKDKEGRVDLRDMPLVTIDGADARDFDDAVYAEQSGQGWRLIVAIADVSQYVKAGDALDKEAVKRGTSTYFPDRVVPMLPEALSNGLCSLNPDVDRLCLVCEMKVSATGKVDRAKFYRGVMRSHARLTYSQVNDAVVKKDKKARARLAKVLPQLECLHTLYGSLARARARRGALDLELPEVRITLADDRHTIESIAPYERNDAHKLIEECMIAANVQAAKFLRRHKLPTLYRVHPEPELDRFEELRLMLQELGYKVPAEARTQPRALNKILQTMRERPDFAVMGMSILRTLSQAVYQPGNEGHFGLALDAYAHFTSPIRRYPDLLVHRGIGHILEGKKPGAFDYKPPDMDHLGRVTSLLERQAEAASRHVESRYKCIYLKEHVGGEFNGVITGVTHFGLFVMLDDLFVEGLIHVTSLRNDYYHVVHGGLGLKGEHTESAYGLGDTVRVKISRVDVDEARVDLSLVDDQPPSDTQKHGKSAARQGKTHPGSARRPRRKKH
jgi:ribonuclease R